MRHGKPTALLISAVVAAALLACCTGSSTAPDALIGVWTTDAEESADVSIEFSRDRLVISSDTGVFENSIEKVKAEKGDVPGVVLYNVYYLDRDGETNLMSFFYAPEEGGAICFKSERDVEWKKRH
ncbi:MAG TPA: hypothetical protein PLE36_12840 [Deltaproteobacteria bacterium]|jgi:hypothetical protein|nr:hypothetical protein [Deltaproteobacteria bacterium]MDI9541814.1 hypothetical protein [Pseudomonadota bacterium]NLW68678.1 hypothetical protein [Bacteriovoracaceae bacterium]HRR21890.1 hypothetical protein [Desulfomonilia bacterium]HNR51333.1 hypothetical protein [Deltaproteobacteria bacterium]